MVVRFTGRALGEVTLRTWHNKFAGTGTSQTCKGKEEIKVTTAGAGKVLTWKALKTGLRKKTCLETGFLCWYVGVVVTFTTLTETALTERLDKTTLNILRQTLRAHSLKWVTEAFQIVWFTETRGGSRTAATSKMECFVIIVNGWKPLASNTKHSILDVAAALDLPLEMWTHSFLAAREEL